MKQKIVILQVITLSIFLAYCTNPNGSGNDIQETSDSALVTSESDVVSEADTSSTVLSDGHTSQNALDWAGTYEGTLPCADCEGIKTTIKLNSDNSYLMKEEYLGEDAVFETEGKFTWDTEGRIITLTDKNTHRNFQVGEDNLLHLDQEGNIIEGSLADYYILKKLPAEK